MELNKSNYFSIEADNNYMSVSLFKSFLEELGGCEAKAIAKLDGKYKEAQNDAFLLGSYVHSWSEGALEEFKINNPGMFSSKGATKGQLKSNFLIAEKMIKTLQEDSLIEKVREGDKEIILTSELFEVPWKIQIDVLGARHLADIKTTRSITNKTWNEFTREKENFILNYRYDYQMAVYAEIERLSRKGIDYKEPHIIAVSKEDIPDKAVINFGTKFISPTLQEIEYKFERVKRVWQRKDKPTRCEKCDYCRSTKKINEIIYYMDL